MCVNCGYDLKENLVHEPEVGEAVAAPAEKDSAKDFVLPGRGSAQVLATCGVFLTLAALIAAGIAGRQWGAMVIIGSVALVLYNIAVHTCTGVVAVIVAARLSEERFSRFEIVAARMFVAVSLFYAASSVRLPISPEFLARGLPWVAALAVYFLLILFLFKKDRFGASLIALAHFMMWVILQLGTHLAAWVAAGQVAAVPAAP
jgi:hypothetical protein